MRLYSDLPGIELEIKDGNLVLPAQDLGSDRVLILGPSVTTGRALEVGETLEVIPRRIQGSEDFTTYGLGYFNELNPLATAWKQAHDAGCRDIWVIEVPGETAPKQYSNLHAIYTTIQDHFASDIVVLSGIFAPADAADTVDFDDANIVILEGTTDYSLLGSPQTDVVEELVLADFTTDTYVIPNLVAPGTLKLFKGLTADLATRTNYLPLNEGATADYTYDAETRTITLAVTLGATETVIVEYKTYEFSFAAQLAGFCSSVSMKNNQTLGIIAAKHVYGTLSTLKTALEAQPIRTYNQFLTVVSGPGLYFEINNGPYMSDFAGAYAGLVSILPSYSAPTNKVIPGVLSSSHNLSPTLMKDMINKSMVIPRIRNGRVVVADAITTAPAASDFIRLTTVRTVNDAVNLIREIAEPYIGEPNTMSRRNGLETAIDTALNGMIRRGALNDFRFSIKSTLADQISGDMRISLDLVPVFETRRIFITVALKPSL